MLLLPLRYTCRFCKIVVGPTTDCGNFRGAFWHQAVALPPFLPVTKPRQDALYSLETSDLCVAARTDDRKWYPVTTKRRKVGPTPKSSVVRCFEYVTRTCIQADQRVNFIVNFWSYSTALTFSQELSLCMRVPIPIFGRRQPPNPR